MKNSDKIILYLGRNPKKSKTWLALEMNISRVTLNRKLKDNNFDELDLRKLKLLGIL